MRVTLNLSVLMAFLACLMAGHPAFSQLKDAGIEGLKQEMSDVPGAPAAAPAVAAPVAVAGDAAPVIEELAAPAAEPVAKKKEPAPVAPAIEELAPAVMAPAAPVAAAPAAVAEPVAAPVAKEEVPVAPAAPAAPAIEELAPAPAAVPVAPAVAPEKAPEVAPAPAVAEAPKAEAPVAVSPVVAAPAALDPDAATKQALETAVKNFGTADRVKLGQSVAQQEEVRRKARELDGRKAMELADQSWKDRDYTSAAEQYKIAFSKLAGAPAVKSLRDRANERIPDCEYEIILRMAKEGKKDDSAITMGEEFLKLRPGNSRLRSLLAKLRENQAEKLKQGAATQEDEGAVGNETDVEKQMRLGKGYMANREYAKSRACFESVLGLDPDNREAMRYLKVLGEREYNNKSVEREATVRKMEAEVRDTWNPKYKVIKGREVAAAAKPTGPTTSMLEEKMKKIVIDEIEFRAANMHDVVDFLNKRSRDCDKTTDEDAKKGVNIILNLGNASQSAPAKAAGSDDVFAADADKGAGGTAGVPEVTFSARYITLFNAMKIITDVAGLKWRIDGDVVMIVPKDWSAETMEMRMYPVEPTFIERVKMASTEMPAANSRVGGHEMTTIDKGGIEGAPPTDLKAYFENMGVKFPKGSTVNYSQAIGKVIVLNTSDNLAAFEKILAELNVVPKQVEIEARFVEVNETDLYEAGLEWLLTDNYEMLMKNNSNPFAPASSNPRIQMNANSADGGITKGLRFWGTDSSSKEVLQSGGSGNMGSIASFASVLTNPDLTMILHALEQNGNADLLSAPKVTTRSGTEATIKVVTEFIYPTSFEVQGGQLQSQQANQNAGSIVQETTVVPQDFATREVGVILNVMPEVSPDGNMINLTMKPAVVTEPVWFQYGSTVRRADGSTMQMNMPQPFFQVRTLETQISIYDGATVVMGGLITESVEKANDKIPILGDIPFLGALFRSKSEKSVKKNLLIFVTAKLVDPAGHLIRNQEQDLAKPASAPATAPTATPAPTK